MATVDEIVAALGGIPAAERVGWRSADELCRLGRGPRKHILAVRLVGT
ncbi:hypothetical protein [Actinoplanes sp. NPDC026623]